MSEFVKMAVTPALPENFLLRARLFTGNYHYISSEFKHTSKNLRVITKIYFREKHCFLKKGFRNMGVWRYTLISLFVEQVFQVLPKIILQPLVSILIVLITVGLAAGQTLLYSDNSTKWLHCKKGTDFTVPTTGGMIPIKLSLAGNNLIIPRQGKFGQ